MSVKGRATAVCTLAISLLGAASAQIVVWMNGGPMDAPRGVGVAVAVGLGSFLVWLGHCLPATSGGERA